MGGGAPGRLGSLGTQLERGLGVREIEPRRRQQCDRSIGEPYIELTPDIGFARRVELIRSTEAARQEPETVDDHRAKLPRSPSPPTRERSARIGDTYTIAEDP